MRKKYREEIIGVTMTVLDGIFTLGGATIHAFVDQKSFYRDINSDDYTRRQISNRVRDLINSGHIEARERKRFA